MWDVQRSHSDELRASQVPQEKFTEAPEVYWSARICIAGLLLTVLGNIWWLNNHALARSLLTAIGTALLGAAFITLTEQIVLQQRYKNHIKPFQDFWGQKYKSRVPGKILLQADSIEELSMQFIKARERWFDLGSQPERSLQNRIFKARTWINRFDTEGAKDIRVLFASANFETPLFHAVDRAESVDNVPKVGDDNTQVGPKNKIFTPFEIFMGLGFTANALTIVNDICQGFLHVTLDIDEGDAIDVDIRHLPKQAPVEVEFRNLFNSEFYRLVPRGWSHEKLLGLSDQIKMFDYGYFLRYRGKKYKEGKTVMFHVGGFTEHGTWATANYLANHWRDSYESTVKNQIGNDVELSITVVAGTIPFQSEHQRKSVATWHKLTEIYLDDEGKPKARC